LSKISSKIGKCGWQAGVEASIRRGEQEWRRAGVEARNIKGKQEVRQAGEERNFHTVGK
jgi:hypothetical protein